MKAHEANGETATDGSDMAIHLRRILVPVDFSETSRKAARYAAGLARQYRAEALLIHVVDLSDINRVGLRLGPVAEERMTEEATAHARKQIDEFGRDALGDEIEWSSDVLNGQPSLAILKQAKEWRADLVVVATHSEKVFKHMVIGSTAERIARLAPCPVLVVRDVERDFVETHSTEEYPERCRSRLDYSPVWLRKILVPLDFSDRSKKALRYAGALAEQFGSKTVLTHVLSVSHFIPDGYSGIDLSSIRRDAKNEAEERLSEIAGGAELKDLPVVMDIREGRSATEIVELAIEEAVDLIVISTHGHSDLKHVFLGSVAENVIRHAPCPTLVVRERERDFVGE